MLGTVIIYIKWFINKFVMFVHWKFKKNMFNSRLLFNKKFEESFLHD